ncbi:MAG: AEC family transporter [Actinomycetia bacterium]|nr:AEC family transporter [Actinomycetes bacterium]
MATLAPVILGVLGYVGLGIVLRVTGLLSAEDSKPLNTLLIYAALPALVFSTVQPARATAQLAIVPVLAWVIALAGVAIAWVLTRAFRLEGPTAGAFILVAAFGNTAYIGYPVASALLGDAGLVRAIFYDIFGNTAAIITIGALIAGHYGERDVKVNPLRELVTFPPFIALVLALALRSVAVPALVSGWLGALGKLVVPMIMVSVGLSLKPRAVRAHLGKLGVIASVKLLVMPLVALGIGTLLVHDPASLRILVLEAGVPSMMLTVTIGMKYQLDVDLIASAILVTVLGAVLTIPLMQLLV